MGAQPPSQVIWGGRSPKWSAGWGLQKEGEHDVNTNGRAGVSGSCTYSALSEGYRLKCERPLKSTPLQRVQVGDENLRKHCVVGCR